MEVKRKSEVWEIINRERRRRGRINEEIGVEEWKDYFMDVLGGVKGVRWSRGKGNHGKEDEKIGEGEEEEGISMREIRKALSRLKEGKAMGLDEIPEEAWRYGGEDVEKWIWGYYNEEGREMEEDKRLKIQMV